MTGNATASATGLSINSAATIVAAAGISRPRRWSPASRGFVSRTVATMKSAIAKPRTLSMTGTSATTSQQHDEDECREPGYRRPRGGHKAQPSRIGREQLVEGCLDETHDVIARVGDRALVVCAFHRLSAGDSRADRHFDPWHRSKPEIDRQHPGRPATRKKRNGIRRFDDPIRGDVGQTQSASGARF